MPTHCPTCQVPLQPHHETADGRTQAWGVCPRCGWKTEAQVLPKQRRNVLTRGFFLWPLLWIALCYLVQFIGQCVVFGLRQSMDDKFILGCCGVFVGILGLSPPLAAGFVMGNRYWHRQYAELHATGYPTPWRWKYPILFALGQWGLTVAYAILLGLAILVVLFGACVFINKAHI